MERLFIDCIAIEQDVIKRTLMSIADLPPEVRRLIPKVDLLVTAWCKETPSAATVGSSNVTAMREKFQPEEDESLQLWVPVQILVQFALFQARQDADMLPPLVSSSADLIRTKEKDVARRCICTKGHITPHQLFAAAFTQRRGTHTPQDYLRLLLLRRNRSVARRLCFSLP
jgi:hypothetical protein